jgi:Tol biopolymer transport system component
LEQAHNGFCRPRRRKSENPQPRETRQPTKALTHTLLTVIALKLCFSTSAAPFTGKIAYTKNDLWLKTDLNNLAVPDTRLTNTKRISELNPRFSPDGNQLAFIHSPRGVRVMKAEPESGSNPRRQLTTFGAWPTWSANGEWLAFWDPDTGIWVVRADETAVDGPSLQQLTTHGGWPSWSPTFSVDPMSGVGTTQIVFVSDLFTPGDDDLLIMEVQLDTEPPYAATASTPVPLLSDPFPGADSNTDFQPAGAPIFSHYVSKSLGHDIFKVGLKAEALVPVSLNTGSGGDWEARWSPIQPDGKRWIAYRKSTPSSPQIWVKDEGGNNDQLLISNGAHPIWGP